MGDIHWLYTKNIGHYTGGLDSLVQYGLARRFFFPPMCLRIGLAYMNLLWIIGGVIFVHLNTLYIWWFFEAHNILLLVR